MKRINTIRLVSRLMLLGLLAAVFLIFTSCGSAKDKQLQKQQTETETNTSTTSVLEEKKETAIALETEAKKESKNSNSSLSFESEKGESLTIIEENLTTGEKKKTTYIGSGKLHKSEGESTSVSNEKTKSVIKIEEKKLKKNKIINHTKSKESSLQKSKVKESGFNWWWLVLLIIPVGFYYYNKKYNWFFRVSNYVTTLLKK